MRLGGQSCSIAREELADYLSRDFYQPFLPELAQERNHLLLADGALDLELAQQSVTNLVHADRRGQQRPDALPDYLCAVIASALHAQDDEIVVYFA